jgi:hypothetical protein
MTRDDVIELTKLRLAEGDTLILSPDEYSPDEIREFEVAFRWVNRSALRGVQVLVVSHPVGVFIRRRARPSLGSHMLRTTPAAGSA